MKHSTLMYVLVYIGTYFSFDFDLDPFNVYRKSEMIIECWICSTYFSYKSKWWEWNKCICDKFLCLVTSRWLHSKNESWRFKEKEGHDGMMDTKSVDLRINLVVSKNQNQSP